MSREIPMTPERLERLRQRRQAIQETLIPSWEANIEVLRDELMAIDAVLDREAARKAVTP